MPIQFVIDLYSSNLNQEVEKFVSLFKTIENVKRDTITQNQDKNIAKINQSLLKNRILNDKRFSRQFKLENSMYDGSNIWLVKPNDFNRGRGVMLFNSLN